MTQSSQVSSTLVSVLTDRGVKAHRFRDAIHLAEENRKLIQAAARCMPLWIHLSLEAYMCLKTDVLFFCFSRQCCSLGCPGTHSVDQAHLELRKPPACLPSAGIKGIRHHCLASMKFLMRLCLLDSHNAFWVPRIQSLI